MSTRASIPRPPAITVDGTVPFPPETIVEHLRLLRQHIPDFGPLAVPDAASLRRAAHVADDLIQAAANTVGASKFVANSIGKTADGLRLERDEVSRWSAVEHETEAMLKGIVSANLVRRHRLGMSALQTYLITRQLVRLADHADLLPHVEAMRRVNKFGRRRRVQAAAPATVPAVP